MRLVHASDLHLGFTAYERTLSTGINVREADVARTFSAFIDQTIAIAPELVVIGGDVFHRIRPSNASITHAFKEFSRLCKKLPNVTVVLVAGNHDIPRSGDVAGVLPLFAEIDGMHIADRSVREFYFPHLSLSVVAVPDAPGLQRPPLEPDPRATHRVLVLHGEVSGMPGQSKGEREAIIVDDGEIGVDRWSYVALGHYHVAHEIRPNWWYAGSIDFTSSNPWSELAAPKGFIERDLETGVHTFHELPASRRYLDLAPIDATGLGADEVDALIRVAVDASSIDNAVVRLRVDHITQEVGRALNQKALREFKARALNFHLDERRAERVRPESIALVRQMGQTIAERVTHELETRELTNDVDRSQLVDLAQRYLADATEKLGDSKTTSNEPVPLIPDAAPQRRTA